MNFYVYYFLCIFMICFIKIECNQMNQCTNMEPNKIKILGPINKMKVWLGSEVTVTCCMKDQKQTIYNNDDIEDEFEPNSSKEYESLMWYDPNMKPVENYFSNPTDAQRTGIYSLPDMGQKTNNVQMIHLIIKNFTLSNNGVYKCETAQKSNLQPAEIKFEGHHKIIIDAEAHQFLEENNEGNIICNPSGHDNIDVVWFYEGKHLSPDDHRFSFLKRHRVLRVSKVTEQIAGKYLCKAEVTFADQRQNQLKGQFIELQPIEVTVYQQPVLSSRSPIIIDSVNNGKFEDGVLELACEANGLPPPDIRWYKNNKLINSNLNSRIKITESYYRRDVYSTLRIYPVDAEDIGTYTCNASIHYKNFIRSDAKNVTPELMFQPRFLSVLTNLNASSLLGQDITLNCTVFGASLNRISLSFEQNDYNNTVHIYNELSENSRFIFRKFQDMKNPYISHYELKIIDIEASDAGWYYCKASLKFRNIYTISNVGVFSVFYKPTVTSNKSTVYGLWFKRNVLKCTSKGFPSPEWIWKFHDNLLPKELNQYKVLVTNNNDTSVSELIISPNYLNDAVFGSYKCIASNKFGSDTKSIFFLQAWQPGPPTIERCKVTSSSIQLCVNPNNDTGGLPLSHYELRIKEFGIDRYVGPFYYPVNPSTITLSHLKSNMKYKFALSAVSEAGRGVNSYLEIETKPLSRPLVELVNTSLSPDWNAFHLRWVVDTDGGLPIVQYDVEIQQVRVDLQTHKIIERVGPVKNLVIHDIGQLKHMFRVNSLRPNTYYELKFWAENLIGPSPIQEVVFRTLDHPFSKDGSARLIDPYGSSNSIYNCGFRNLGLLLFMSLFIIKNQS